ncbi:hypothetical protein KP79_PYT18617 [Mizuhopecten yessoensis]|uniref:Nudix hydrolase domain-containing protein n=1 Tax=Mizuhopecten yessoensis TaxID=6573 RepID=A0A210R1M0_MIZYE|nr:hypothetical protein KP79_PYT18617 [Mizuhopecten yessoensis]
MTATEIGCLNSRSVVELDNLWLNRRRSQDFEHVPSELAFRICAIRETFEDSGVILVRNADGSLKSSNFKDVPLAVFPSRLISFGDQE